MDKIFEDLNHILSSTESITLLSCYVKDKLNDEYTAHTIASLFDAFSYQMTQTALTIEYNTKNEISSVAAAFKMAMRSESLFDLPKEEEVKDILSSDSMRLLGIAKKLSGEVMQIIDDVYAFTEKYSTSSAKSKEEMLQLAKELKSVSTSIDCNAQDIKMSEGDDEDGSFF